MGDVIGQEVKRKLAHPIMIALSAVNAVLRQSACICGDKSTAAEHQSRFLNDFTKAAAFVFASETLSACLHLS
jgi:hypothetical protein